MAMSGEWIYADAAAVDQRYLFDEIAKHLWWTVGGHLASTINVGSSCTNGTRPLPSRALTVLAANPSHGARRGAHDNALSGHGAVAAVLDAAQQ